MLLESPKRLITNTDLLVRRLLNLTVVKEDIVVISLAIEHVVITGKPYIVELNFI